MGQVPAHFVALTLHLEGCTAPRCSGHSKTYAELNPPLQPWAPSCGHLLRVRSGGRVVCQ